MDAPRQDTDSPPTGEPLVDVAEAARRLGVSADAVRSRIRRGTLPAEKVRGQWRVRVPAAEVRQDAPVEQQDADRQETGTDRTQQDATTAQLAEVIDRLSQHLTERDQRIQEQHEEIERLSGQEAMWRTHALHLQSRVEQLEQGASVEAVGAGEGDQDARNAESPQPDDTDDPGQPESLWQRLWRLLQS